MTPQEFYARGKLLLTGEYLVLHGALSLAVPCVLGQKMIWTPHKSEFSTWNSYDVSGELWFQSKFCLAAVFSGSAVPKNKEEAVLFNLLLAAYQQNPNIASFPEADFKTYLDFNRAWGLGSSSTLVSLVAQWAAVNPYLLLEKVFGGSGYDVACATASSPILFRKTNGIPHVTPINFKPAFSKELFFVYLNQKQNSQQEVAQFIQSTSDYSAQIQKISSITNAVLEEQELDDFIQLMNEHEQILSQVLKRKTISEERFPDYSGMIKSLGAWGGDFILCSGDKTYFEQKDFSIIFDYDHLVIA